MKFYRRRARYSSLRHTIARTNYSTAVYGPSCSLYSEHIHSFASLKHTIARTKRIAAVCSLSNSLCSEHNHLCACQPEDNALVVPKPSTHLAPHNYGRLRASAGSHLHDQQLGTSVGCDWVVAGGLETKGAQVRRWR